MNFTRFKESPFNHSGFDEEEDDEEEDDDDEEDEEEEEKVLESFVLPRNWKILGGKANPIIVDPNGFKFPSITAVKTVLSNGYKSTPNHSYASYEYEEQRETRELDGYNVEWTRFVLITTTRKEDSKKRPRDDESASESGSSGRSNENDAVLLMSQQQPPQHQPPPAKRQRPAPSATALLYMETITIRTPSIGITILEPDEKNEYCTIGYFYEHCPEGIRRFHSGSSIIALSGISTRLYSCEQVQTLAGRLSKPYTITLQSSIRPCDGYTF